MQSDWSRGYWPITFELLFFQIQTLCKLRAINMNFYLRPNVGKINKKNFKKLKKIFWGSFCPNLGGQINKGGTTILMPTKKLT